MPTPISSWRSRCLVYFIIETRHMYKKLACLFGLTICFLCDPNSSKFAMLFKVQSEGNLNLNKEVRINFKGRMLRSTYMEIWPVLLEI